MTGKALMTHYAEGSLISRELNDMMTDYAAEARFNEHMHDDIDLYGDQKAAQRSTAPTTSRSLIKEGLVA